MSVQLYCCARKKYGSQNFISVNTKRIWKFDVDSLECDVDFRITTDTVESQWKVVFEPKTTMTNRNRFNLIILSWERGTKEKIWERPACLDQEHRHPFTWTIK